MWTLPLFRHQARRDWIQGLDNPAPALIPDFIAGDEVELAIQNVADSPSAAALPAVVVVPWSFTAIRASVGLINAAPNAGTFKLQVGDQTTAELTWPDTLATAAQIATWKAEVLAALLALSNVDADGLRADDPDDAPGHFLYFTWTDPEDDREIEIVDVALTPSVAATVEPLQGVPAYTQLLKFVQLPFIVTDAFDFPTAVPPSIATEIEGAVGTNEVQILTIPSTATGALALIWDDVTTRPLALTDLTAGAISTALNEIVANGSTNPSFRVTQRTRGKFAIEFIGPLAGAAQVALVVDPRLDPVYTAVGSFVLSQAKVERALNGEALLRARFEVVFTQDGGDQTILREINLRPRLTGPTTIQSAEEADAVLVLTETVYVDNSTLEPIATVSPGFAYLPAIAATTFVITHSLGTWFPRVSVHYQTQLDPERWKELPLDGTYTATATSSSAVTLTFAVTLSEDEEDDHFAGRYKVFVSSPDATVQLLEHDHAFANIRETLPAGVTLTAKLAELAAAIGMVDGALLIDAARISGALQPGQIDLSALAVALRTNGEFLNTLITLAGNPALANAIGAGLRDSTTFLETLKTLLADPEVLQVIIDGLSESTDFLTLIRDLVNDALQGGGVLPVGTSLWTLTEYAPGPIPAPTEIPGPSRRSAVVVTETTTTAEGGNTTVISRPRTIMEDVDTTLTIYAPLQPAVADYLDGGEIDGALPASATLGTVYTVADGATSASQDARPGRTFADLARITFGAGHWYEVGLVGDSCFSLENEHTLFHVRIAAGQLFPGSRFRLPFELHYQLAGEVRGLGRLVLEQGASTATGADGDLAGTTWTQIYSQVLHFGPDLNLTAFSITIEHSDEEDLTGEIQPAGAAVEFTPAAATLALRGRITAVDFEDADLPRGALTIRRPSTIASIVAL